MIRESSDNAEISAAMTAAGLHGFVMLDGWRYFIAYRAEKAVGVLAAEPAGNGVWLGHMSLGPDSGGMASRYARQAARRLLETGAQRVLGVIPANNQRSLRAALGAGFRYISKVDGHHVTEFVRA